MKREIPLSVLREVAVLFPGDLYELAAFLLKAYDARDRESNLRHPSTIQRSRPTLRGLAYYYGLVLDVGSERVESLLAAAGFDLGAIVEFDAADSMQEHGLDTD